jgi:type II secretory pathway pseudopilin PulG
MKRLKQNHLGFTVVEIIVGLAVAGIVVPAIAIIMTTITSLNDRTTDTIQANGIIEKKVEALRSADFVALSDGVVDFTNELPQSFARPNNAIYTISSVNVALKQVDIHIQYTVGGAIDEFDFTTYIGELGVGQ